MYFLLCLSACFCDMWHLTCDTWHITCDAWRVTCDTWWVGEVNLLLKFQLSICYGLGIKVFWRNFDKRWVTESMKELQSFFCRTDPATLGLLNIYLMCQVSLLYIPCLSGPATISSLWVARSLVQSWRGGRQESGDNRRPGKLWKFSCGTSSWQTSSRDKMFQDNFHLCSLLTRRDK